MTNAGKPMRLDHQHNEYNFETLVCDLLLMSYVIDELLPQDPAVGPRSLHRH